MGSVDNFEDRELTFLVTGFGPFKTEYPVNPSWEIAASLPEYLPWDRVSAKMPRVRLLVHPEPIRVNYQVVRDLVPKLWDGPKIDFALHIGMAGPTNVYSLEQRAHRDGYKLKDVDGNNLEDEERHKKEGEKWIWDGFPAELVSNLDIQSVYQKWVQRCPKEANLRISHDPGRYLCDFIYYSSMAHLTRQSRPRKVAFFHVPADGSKASVVTGTELSLQLIRSIVESEIENMEEAVGQYV